ncbi:MAG: hypothetical protein K2I03_13060 [Lachnospiraceae bacterium]|nr:hypothetical protein [Lachnospiraceae bacterium]
MIENDKIKKLIQKYIGYFENSNVGVCLTIKGMEFSVMNSKYNYYECFVWFKTVKELKEIVLGELIDYVNAMMEIVADKIDNEYGYENDVAHICDFEGV